jgi:LPS O-antigen subunit length determinant protein (WzzB/FepE family)
MQKNIPDKNYYQEDGIDLKELFGIVWAKKTLIIGMTTVITLVAGIYVFNKTPIPIYEVNALIKIGSYQLYNSTSTNKVIVEPATELSKKLNVLFVNKNKVITSISVAKHNSFIDIKSEANSNEIASREILSVMSFIRDKHQKILNDIKNRRELKIKNINTKIDTIKNKEIKLLVEKIKIQTLSLNDHKLLLKNIEKNIKALENTNPELAALKFMEKRDLLSFIVESNLRLIDMHYKKDKLETTSINNLLEKRKLISSILLPHNYKNSEIVGQLITSDYPIKPKKKPIVAVAFIAGFILSIFLVFMMNAFRKEEDTVVA